MANFSSLVEEVCLPLSFTASKLKKRRTRPGKVAKIRQVAPYGITVSLGSEPPVCRPGEQ